MQSQALERLLRRSTGNDDDVLEDGGEQGAGSQSGTGIRSFRRRERYRRLLAQQPGTVGRLMVDHMATLMPSHRLHSSEAPDPLAILERFGGWQSQQQLGRITWEVGRILQAILLDDPGSALDRCTLLFASLDQLRVNSSDPELSQSILLSEAPPVTVFSPGQAQVSLNTGWTHLLPPDLTATNLGFVREIDQMRDRSQRQRGGGPPRWWRGRGGKGGDGTTGGEETSAPPTSTEGGKGETKGDGKGGGRGGRRN